MIERQIWQTAEDDASKLPNSLKMAMNSWIDLNPGWKHNYVDASQRAAMVKELDNDLWFIYQQFDKLEPRMKIYQADIWRYLTVYTYGGVYVDLDTICLLPLDALQSIYMDDFSDKIFIPLDYSNLNYNRMHAEYMCSMCQLAYDEISSTMSEETFYNNAEFAAKKGSVVLAAVLDEIKNRLEVVRKHHSNDFSQSEHADHNYNIFPFIVDAATYGSALSKFDHNSVIKCFVNSQHINELKVKFQDYDIFSGQPSRYYGRIGN